MPKLQEWLPTQSPTAAHASIVSPLSDGSSTCVSTAPITTGTQRAPPATLHESSGQRSPVASGLHDDSLAVPETLHPPTHTHIHTHTHTLRLSHTQNQLLSPNSCASKETLEGELQPKHLQPCRPNTAVEVQETTIAAQ